MAAFCDELRGFSVATYNQITLHSERCGVGAGHAHYAALRERCEYFGELLEAAFLEASVLP